MNRYFATFLSGAQELIEEILRERLRDLRLLSLLDGCVEFETEVPYSDLNLFCFHNVFRVVRRLDFPAGQGSPEVCARELLRSETDWKAAGENAKKIKTFRLVASQENHLVSLEPSLCRALEKRVSAASGLRLDRSRPDTEFWLLSRREGPCWFLKRLSRHTSYDKLLDPGELHPELAYLMCRLSSPRPEDTVLDPFCGYGAIPLQRCRRFPFSKMYAFDSDGRVLKRAGEKLGKRENLILEQRDALSLDKHLPPESVDAVITDPPWGLYQNLGTDLESFYQEAFAQLYRVLKPGGRLVVLTAKKEEFLRATKSTGFSPKREFHILVSGKKAGLYLMEKES